jgi:sec-independent protein translocase protein TatA
MLANLNGWHLLIIVGVVLLLFGAPKLPGLARSVGQSMRIFRGEVKTMKTEFQGDAAADASATATKVEASEISPSVIAPPQPIAADAVVDSAVKP